MIHEYIVDPKQRNRFYQDLIYENKIAYEPHSPMYYWVNWGIECGYIIIVNREPCEHDTTLNRIYYTLELTEAGKEYVTFTLL